MVGLQLEVNFARRNFYKLLFASPFLFAKESRLGGLRLTLFKRTSNSFYHSLRLVIVRSGLSPKRKLFCFKPAGNKCSVERLRITCGVWKRLFCGLYKLKEIRQRKGYKRTLERILRSHISLGKQNR
jgi:hypothetical protein